MNYQGRLTDANGDPLETQDDYTLSFSIFTTSTGGTAVWGPQKFPSVPVVRGHFNVILGPVDDNGKGIDEAFASENAYLEITVGDDQPISPRQRILSTPYALNGTPAGMIGPFAATLTNISPGWLVCDGQPMSRTTYSGLFTAIGTSWGAGDDSTTFHLPDLRGQFLRGVDGSAGNDPDSGSRVASNSGGNAGNAVGSFQEDDFGSHKHKISWWASGGLTLPNTYPGFANSYNPNKNQDSKTGAMPTGGSETRPKNAYVNYIIKY